MRVRTDGSQVMTTPAGIRSFNDESQGSPSLPTEEAARNWRPTFSLDGFKEPPLNTPVWVGKRMTDVEIDNFRRRIADGETLPVNPMSSSFRDESSYSLARYITRTRPVNIGTAARPNWRVSWYRSDCYARVSPRLINYDPPWNAMTTEARAGLSRGFMDVLTTVSEIHKTVELVVGFKTRVKRAIQDLLKNWHRSLAGTKKVFRSFSEAFADLSSFWLEYRFGWRILYYDYLSIVRVIKSYQDEIVKRSHRVTELLPSNTLTTERLELSHFLKAKEHQVTGATARVGIFGSLDLRGNLQIDPVTTAWELLPLSLVIDMFWNVGDSLAAYSPFSNVKEEAIWRSLKRVSLSWSEIEVNKIARDRELVDFECKVGVVSQVTDYFREPLKTGPALPQPQINLSFLKALDLGAISIVLAQGILPKVLNRR